jgi:4-amino-4-deoxy-L-arabinose transferase-like glycosyltransferase
LQDKAVAAHRLIFSLIFALASIRLASLGMYPLMDMTEARYAEIARMMVELNDWATLRFDYDVPFWGKPPLSVWVTAISFKLFGVNEFAARFPHWLAGVFVVWLTWDFAYRRSSTMAMYSTALLCGSALFFLSAGAVMTDMVLVVGTTIAMRGFWLGLHGDDVDRRRERWLFFVGIAIGLLAKGPVVLVLVIVPIVAWSVLSGKVAAVKRGFPWLRGALLTLAIALPWYLLAELRSPGFLDYFIVGEHWNRFLKPGWAGDLYGSAHRYARGTIWLFLLVDLLPWTLILLMFYVFTLFNRSISQKPANEDKWSTYLWLWALTPAIFFTFSRNILWPYVLPGFPAMVLLVGKWLEERPEQTAINRITLFGLVSSIVSIPALVAYMHFSGMNEDRSQKSLIETYKMHRQSDEELIYFGKREFSASFYSSGKAKFINNINIATEHAQKANVYLAVPNEEIKSLPAKFIGSFERLSQHGRYTLYRSAGNQHR